MYFPNYIVNFAGVDKSFTFASARFNQKSIPLMYAASALGGEDLYIRSYEGSSTIDILEQEVFLLEQFPGEDVPEQYVDRNGKIYIKQGYKYYVKLK
jgi:hypothetical protein